MKNSKINLNLGSTAFYVTLFYVAKIYEDILAKNVFWWVTMVSVVAGIVVILFLGQERPERYIHPVTSVFSVITSLAMTWMIWSLGFTWLCWIYLAISVVIFFMTVEYIKA